NNDRTPARNGTGIQASTPGKASVIANLFQGNGPSETSPADDAINVGGGFNPAILGPTPVDALLNITGPPAFVSPRDPRPGTPDGPNIFLAGANYDLQLTDPTTGKTSAAIDVALQAAILPNETDFKNRPRSVDIPNVPPPGSRPDNPGPADIGAFEFQRTGTAAASRTTVGTAV